MAAVAAAVIIVSRIRKAVGTIHNRHTQKQDQESGRSSTSAEVAVDPISKQKQSPVVFDSVVKKKENMCLITLFDTLITTQ